MEHLVEHHDELGRNAAYVECERALGDFARRRSVLTLPNKWAFEARAGGSVTGAQLAVTWARANQPATLRLAADEEPNVAADTFLNRTYGLVAAAFADRIIGRDGERDVTSAMLKLVNRRRHALYSGDFAQMIHGQVLPLISLDHLEPDGPNPLLYHPISGEVRSDFLGVVQQTLGRLIARNRLALHEIDTEALASLFKELFSNTHLHARTDLRGALYRRSARGIVFALRPVDIPHEKHTAGSNSLRQYFSSMKGLAIRPRVEFLEISVFDSGPGLAARANRAAIPDDFSIDEEYQLVRSCFLKNVTTQSDPAHGLGLPRVMLALKTCGGFLRLRTGRLSLYKWFPPGLKVPRFEEEDTSFFDSEGGMTIRSHAPVAGAVFSILIPMGLGS
ncbi:MAG: hypothetical protein E5Y32_02355 [Mesorhizobium sp.]|nr:MAG: hypothetical protein E5Y32_02355 [Mesorhizobium sp.]